MAEMKSGLEEMSKSVMAGNENSGVSVIMKI
jgi:hypothetical protein